MSQLRICIELTLDELDLLERLAFSDRRLTYRTVELGSKLEAKGYAEKAPHYHGHLWRITTAGRYALAQIEAA